MPTVKMSRFIERALLIEEESSPHRCKEDEEDGKESYDGEAQVKVLRKLKDISDRALKEAAII